MRQSHIGAYEKCPYQYRLNVVDKLETIKNQDADNALFLGTAIHYGCETGSVQKMVDNYLSNYYVTTDLHENEIIKMTKHLPFVLDILAQYKEQMHEVQFDFGYFTGTADFLGRNEAGGWDLYDFKYCRETSKEKYLESPQLHIYKYFLEKAGFRIDKLAFIFIPKTGIYQKKTEDLFSYRKRLQEKLSELKATVEPIRYDFSKVTKAFETCMQILQDTTFEKRPSKLCDWCQFQNFCENGDDLMILPENVRRITSINTKPDLFIYGESYTGKTYFIDKFDNVLMLNTDGNIDNITSPVVRIADEITVDGRITKRKFAWEGLQETLQELEKKNNSYETAEKLRLPDCVY